MSEPVEPPRDQDARIESMFEMQCADWPETPVRAWFGNTPILLWNDDLETPC